ncbi:MAG: 3-phosphoshikimate 1-carboxyvinyltransferase [Euryarchaeota archaeon]|nr:3-phosphoshikimate 1-carboxyvinyltransferase [Euryarchaeota archaeon]MDE1837110.1 3-phosphoshikimate 1-carboxyvinyltransferase [Euryarchaeota archaeon]MDE1879678.1 3-phosphoshikimate 1-carboxyvinyltransferase [Euryarchaeota archaeon]MDE2045204.1 3-phosphoshikimate 1-carboxyvinyltransferase [Thermoplasmata archaeon]
MVTPGTARGTLTAPPSKSYTHRALVVAALAEGPTRVIGGLRSEDTLASLRAVIRLGGQLRAAPPEAPPGGESVLPPLALDPLPLGPSHGGVAEIDTAESGTTLRLFSAVAALLPRTSRFSGSPSLARRPLGGLLQALACLGASFDGPPPGRSLPFSVRGPLHGGSVSVSGSESSQFTSALLIALPCLAEGSELQVAGARVSLPYVEATLEVLRQQGVHIESAPSNRYVIPGGQRYRGGHLTVTGDASSAAYFLALGAIQGGPITVKGVDLHVPQADLALLPVLERAGARVRRGERELTVERRGGRLSPFEVDLTASPDLAPLLAVVAAFAQGRSKLLGASHLEAKESDRRQGSLRLAQALGASARATEEGIEVEGPVQVCSLDLRDLSDHRMFMSAAVAAAALKEPSTLEDPRVVRKSYPGFLEDLGSLGIQVEGARGGAPGRST